jgi:hypothetical protein
MLLYGSPAEGLAYLEAAADDDGWYAAAVYAAARKRREDGVPDDGTT